MKQLKHVLLVDDSDATNAMNSYFLRRVHADADIHVAKNGRDALKYLQTPNENTGKLPNPDLILLDLKMPVLDGFGFLEQHQELFPIVPKEQVIVVLSTSMNEEDKKEVARYKPVQGFLHKPLTVRKVEEIVTNYF